MGDMGKKKGKLRGSHLYVILLLLLKEKSLEGEIDIAGLESSNFFCCGKRCCREDCLVLSLSSVEIGREDCIDALEYVSSVIAADGAGNALAAICATFGEAGLSSVAEIKVIKLSHSMRGKSKNLERKRIRKQSFHAKLSAP